ncbi:GerAB/ArcD/ProY family transporter [Sulfobacillus harzensis]|uniref:GerAB/ArcD/ProY family transporter n=1 Tax=Sulfobacillus harzensis TaxID=2729629 RepID=A0A7Y0Q0M6_9FIRM|nr:GerAB/ArcD/ProY family transporter [Sulfobacillus harzensis]
MNGVAEPISPGQYLWLVAISVVAGGIYLWPQYLVLHMRTNGIYALLTTTAIAAGITALEVATALNVRETTFFGVLKKAVPLLGVGFVFPITALSCVLTDGVILALYGHMMQNFFYPLTPILAIEILIIAIAWWLAIRTLSALARSVQFWFPIILLLLVLITALSLPHVSFLSALLPSSHFYIAPWLVGVASTWFLYANGSVVVTLTPHVRWKRPRDAYLVAIAAILGQGAVLLLFYVMGMSTLGPDGVSHLYWPLVYTFSLVSVRTFFFKGIGAFVIMIWTSSIVLYLAVHLFCFTWNITSEFRAPKNWLRWGIAALLAGLFLGITIVMPSVVDLRAVLFHWVTPATLLWTLVAVPIVWLLSVRVVRRHRTDDLS